MDGRPPTKLRRKIFADRIRENMTKTSKATDLLTDSTSGRAKRRQNTDREKYFAVLMKMFIDLNTFYPELFYVKPGF